MQVSVPAEKSVKPRMAHYISYGSLDLRHPTRITLEILELIRANAAHRAREGEGASLLDQNQSAGGNPAPQNVVNPNNLEQTARPSAGGDSFKCLPYHTCWLAQRLPRLSRVTENQGSMPEREPERRLPHPRKAAGTQITHSRHGEVVTKNNNAGLIRGPVIGMGTL
jgi:hypothetical protein